MFSTVLIGIWNAHPVLNDIATAGGFILAVAMAIYSLSVLRSIFTKDSYKDITAQSFELENESVGTDWSQLNDWDFKENIELSDYQDDFR